MPWVNDIVKIRPLPEQEPDGVRESIRLLRESGSYDEYILRCAAEGVEPIFTRAEFDEYRTSPPV